MSTVIGAEVVVGTDGAEKSVGSLKAQLRQAQNEVATLTEKFGATSAEAINAAKRAGELKAVIFDAKKLTDSFNPDKKFQAFSASIRGVVGGFEALKGAQALFGSENKELEASLLKVQAAMALSQGLNEIQESVKAFRNLGSVLKEVTIIQKVITAAQWLWNAAMDANPIGAIVLAITALIAAGYALIKFFMSSAEESKKNTIELEKNTKALENQKKKTEELNESFKINADHRLNMAKATGQSTDAIRALELKLADEKLALAASTREIASNTWHKNLNILASLKAADASEEDIKKQVELTNASLAELNKNTEAYNAAYKEKTATKLKQEEEIASEATARRKKEAEDNKKDIKDAKDKAKELAKTAAEGEKEIRKAKQDAFLAGITDQQELAKEQLRINYDNAQIDIQNSEYNQNQKNELLKQLSIKYWEDLAKIDADAKDKKKIAEDKEADVEMKRMIASIDEQIKLDEDEKKRAKEKAAYKKAVQDAEFGAIDAGIGFLKAIAGKNKALQKASIIAENAMGIAKIVTNTMAANAKALEYGPVLAPPIITSNTVSAAFGIATTVAATAKALKAVGGGDGGGGGADAGGMTAPIAPQVGGTTLNQGQVNQLSNAANRSFVLESDVSGNQERIQRLNRAARIN
jgi:hypothetical protein